MKDKVKTLRSCLKTLLFEVERRKGWLKAQKVNSSQLDYVILEAYKVLHETDPGAFSN